MAADWAAAARQLRQKPADAVCEVAATRELRQPEERHFVEGAVPVAAQHFSEAEVLVPRLL